MKRWLNSFNIYFALAALILAGTGCESSSGGSNPKKELTTIRLYMEGQRADSSTSGTVLVTRNKYPYTIEKEEILNEGDLAKASVVDNPDGTFYIQLGFNDHGALILDMDTVSNKGKHIIVFSQFPIPGLKQVKHKKKSDEDVSEATDNGRPEYPPGTPRQSGWLAAVLIRDRLSNGVFRFTPDASHEEAARIVRGLRNVIVKASKQRLLE
jgi:hypothetical protein